MILVTGATGNVGRQIVEQLVSAGAPVRAVSRRPEQTAWPDGVEAVAGDLTAGLSAEVFRDVTAMHLFPVPDRVAGVVAGAEAAGVRHVTVLSSLAADSDEHGPLSRRHLDVEQAVAASTMTWTFVRPGMFMTNTRQWAPLIRAEGVVRQPYPDSVTAPIHEDDIAAVTVAALLDPGRHAGRAYELSGPDPLSQVDRMAVISRAIGRELRFDELTREQARTDLLRSPWMSEGLADALLSLMAATVGARDGLVLPAVEDVTGRSPRTFASWVEQHRQEFVGA
ncbi:NAD(P)H-binding protein [uncultured Friedmanniella sp.]|uniref:NAD(P)H-binding protein n=1 Tax=uncultured Friedmanniella sp. TaxID=335381 RepID=UPI0035CBDD6A